MIPRLCQHCAPHLSISLNPLPSPMSCLVKSTFVHVHLIQWKYKFFFSFIINHLHNPYNFISLSSIHTICDFFISLLGIFAKKTNFFRRWIQFQSKFFYLSNTSISTINVGSTPTQLLCSSFSQQLPENICFNPMAQQGFFVVRTRWYQNNQWWWENL